MASTSKVCAGKDAFERMNYLYQLSRLCTTGEIKNAEPLARFYAHNVFAISKKTVQRIDPGIKRKICKSCHQYLLPGKTCKIRVKKKVVVHKCMLCHAEKRFPATPDYVLWNQRPEACAELLDFRIKAKEDGGIAKTKKIKKKKGSKTKEETKVLKIKVADKSPTK